MYGFVYITTNLINGKQYIGQHKGDGSDNYLGSGDRLIIAIKKYGKHNFKREIIEFANSVEELNELERYYITLANAVKSEDFYNIANGGYVNPHNGEENGMFGKHHTLEAKNKMSKTKKEIYANPNHYIHSKEYSMKMSEITKGKKNGMSGKRHTEESKNKMSVNSRGKTLGEKNGNYGCKGDKAKNGKQIKQWQDKEHTVLIKEFNTVTLALEYLGLVGHSQLYKAIKDNTLYKGYYWSK